MNLAHLFEAAMLVCFGFSWPLNVIKAYKARTAKGTSLPFIILIITGYLAGISAKIINGQFNYVLVVYIRNKALDKKVEAKKSLKITANDIKNVVEKEDTMMNYTYSLDELIHKPAAAAEKKNAVILMGSSIDTEIPVSNLAKEFNFDIYNKSDAKLSVENAKLWNPEATKTSSAFAYNMGLKIRKPLNDVAEILYSWAFHNIKSNTTETLVG